MARKKKVEKDIDIDNLIANEQVIDSDIVDEAEDSMITYAIKTIIDRAIPDVRDGMKPVHRRILYGAYMGRYMPDKKYSKNAKIVGEVMGKYHPHGDSSIYDTMVAMSQPWKYRYPLLDFQGNNGSYDGDTAAAMRYSEGRLDKLALTMLQDVETKCVPFKLNYSEELDEPEVLPGLFPNLLANGTSGIAVGYTTEIPSHQLGEVIDAIISVINNSEATIDDIMKHIQGPDFPNGGFLINNENIKNLYETGTASLTFKAKYELEQNEETNNTQIVFTELPPDTKKPKLVEHISNLCIVNKEIPRVVSVKDTSEENDTRIVIELHKTAVPDIVINELYEKTQLKKNMTFYLRVIVNNAPKLLNLKQMIEYYIEHRRDVVTNRTKFILDKTQFKLHIQEGLKIVLGDVKKAIAILENSDTTDDARKELMSHFKLSEDQANQVLEIKFRQLIKMNRQEIENLIKELQSEIADLQVILSGQIEIDKVIIKELKQLKKEFNDERRTILVSETEAQDLNTVTNNEPIALVLTSKNTIKHITIKALDDMFKNGALKERQEVFIQGVKCQIQDEFVLILNTGEYVKIGFSDLMGNLPNENKTIKAIVSYNEERANKTIVTMTKKGIIQKVKLSGLKARMKRVAPLLQIQDGDEIVDVRVIEETPENIKNNIITIGTKDGLIHRFFLGSFKDTAAGSKGISGITLTEADNEVIGFEVTNIDNDSASKIIVFTKHNDGNFGMKSMKLDEFKPKGRVAQGVRGVDFSKKLPGVVHGVVIASDDFFVTDKKGTVMINKFAKLPEHAKYNKPDPVAYEVNTTKFFLE
jgi:DNA gyrase subunit A